MKINYRNMLEKLAIQARRALATAKPDPAEEFRCEEFKRLHQMSEKVLGELQSEGNAPDEWFEKLKPHDAIYDNHEKQVVFALTNYDHNEGGIYVEWREGKKVLQTFIPKKILKEDMVKWNP